MVLTSLYRMSLSFGLTLARAPTIKFCQKHPGKKLARIVMFGSAREACEVCIAERNAEENERKKEEEYQEAIRNIPPLTTLKGKDKATLQGLCDILRLNREGKNEDELAERIFRLRVA